MNNDYDFSGYATRFDIKCSDGRTIRHSAFDDQDGDRVALVFNHVHDDKSQVLGHADLECREDGVYCYGSFNDNEAGREAKEMVMHGDLNALSIWANHLKQDHGDVLHGVIREVSLVMAGANPGAYIDCVSLAHSDDEFNGEIDGATITPFETDYLNVIRHSCSDKRSKTLEHAADEEDKKTVDEAKEEAESSKEDKTDLTDAKADAKEVNKTEGETDMAAENEKTVKEVFDTLNEEQKTVVYALIAQALEDQDKSGSAQEEPEEDEEEMKHNVFDNGNYYDGGDTLSHDEMATILNDGKRLGSLKESFLAHADDYGIQSISYLFPDAQTLNNTPDFISRRMDWVQDVMGNVHHTKFSHIKSIHADITEDEARARGYITSKLKKNEVFKLLKRTTDPTTVYKHQKIDRDDQLDITDFDVVAWLKSEMRTMLDEELARAFLIGDGRDASSDDKIDESKIRPIWTDADLYSVKVPVAVAHGATDAVKAKTMIRTAVKARKLYKGSGNPTLFTTEDWLTEMLLLEDKNERVIYDTVEKLATALRVKNIVTVPVMEGQTRTDSESTSPTYGKTLPLMGIIVNMADYNVGADNGGSINMFDDFDIDYNQQKYLIETRCSGALTKPYSALVLELNEAEA